MKMPVQPLRARFEISPRRHDREGMAVIIVMIMVSIIMIYVAFNLRTLAYLGRELRLIERRQVQRLQAMTNAPANKPVPDQPQASAGSPP